MNLIESLLRRPSTPAGPARHLDIINVPGLGYGAYGYGVGLTQTLTSDREVIGRDFSAYVQGAYKSNGVVFAAELVRMSLFSEARLAFQRLRDNRPGDLFGTQELAIFERPWTSATTSDFLMRSLLYADMSGNAFAVRRGRKIRMLRPDWVQIVMAADNDVPPSELVPGVDVEVVGYEYHHGGFGHGSEVELFLAEDTMHFAPIPDPEAMYRGMSWLTPVIREIQADSQGTVHKQKFYENGATPNMVVKLDVTDEERFKSWVRVLEQNHAGFDNAYKTLYLAAGSDATVVGANMQQVDFKAIQAAGEVRIAAASGIHPTILGLSEGLQGSSLNAGNFSAARRLVGDKVLRPLWRNFCGSAETLVDTPGDARLWYDDRDIPFLRDDSGDAAAIRKEDALTIESLIRSGFKPVSASQAVISGDFSVLEHTGLISVQLQAPGAGQSAPDTDGEDSDV